MEYVLIWRYNKNAIYPCYIRASNLAYFYIMHDRPRRAVSLPFETKTLYRRNLHNLSITPDRIGGHSNEYS